MNDVVITGYLRTPFSRSHPKKPEVDVFRDLRADQLLTPLPAAVLEKAGVDPELVDDFIVGSALGVNEQWTYGGRTPLFLANLPASIPAKFLDQQCGSSMAALHTGFLEIAAGSADAVLVAGMEHMTRVPIGPSLYASGRADINQDLFDKEEYAHWNMPVTMNMGITAETLSQEGGFSREDLDQWAVRSHTLATQARDEGYFADEIMPVEGRTVDGTAVTVDSDQCIRAGSSMESLGKLKPAFSEDGAVTAGNASPLNAGASCMLLMSRAAAEREGAPILGSIRSVGFRGVDPTVMGRGPVPATQRALKMAGLSVGDIDLWEINEAFAAVVLYAIKELGIDPDKVNVRGGALALGHAMGATGVRLVGTLARLLAERDVRIGCASACVGGGQGVATIIERA